MKSKSKPLPALLKQAQIKVNKAIRLRDKELGCICRGCNGQVEHASHYFSQGHHSYLRFDHRNIHGSCAKCNLFLSGNLIKYRQGLIDRYGEQYVKDLEELEANAPKVFKWDRQSLEEILFVYK